MTWTCRAGATQGSGPPAAAPSRRAARAGDRGTVTAEIALGMLGLSVVFGGVLSVVNVGLTKLATQDAATAAARAVARGESLATAQARALQVAGPHSFVNVSRGGELTTATVSARATILIPGAGPLTVVSRAAALSEAAPGESLR